MKVVQYISWFVSLHEILCQVKFVIDRHRNDTIRNFRASACGRLNAVNVTGQCVCPTSAETFMSSQELVGSNYGTEKSQCNTLKSVNSECEGKFIAKRSLDGRLQPMAYLPSTCREIEINQILVWNVKAGGSRGSWEDLTANVSNFLIIQRRPQMTFMLMATLGKNIWKGQLVLIYFICDDSSFKCLLLKMEGRIEYPFDLQRLQSTTEPPPTDTTISTTTTTTPGGPTTSTDFTTDVFTKFENISTKIFPPTDTTSTEVFPPIDTTSTEVFPPIDTTSTEVFPPIDTTTEVFPPIETTTESFPPIEVSTTISPPTTTTTKVFPTSEDLTTKVSSTSEDLTTKFFPTSRSATSRTTGKHGGTNGKAATSRMSTTTLSTTTSTTVAATSSQLGLGATIGIAVAVAVLIMIVIGIVIFMCIRRSSDSGSNPQNVLPPREFKNDVYIGNRPIPIPPTYPTGVRNKNFLEADYSEVGPYVDVQGEYYETLDSFGKDLYTNLEDKEKKPDDNAYLTLVGESGTNSEYVEPKTNKPLRTLPGDTNTNVYLEPSDSTKKAK